MPAMRYTTPGLSCWGTWSLGCTRSCHKVLIGAEGGSNAKGGQDSCDGL